jgi:hypothetical protein
MNKYKRTIITDYADIINTAYLYKEEHIVKREWHDHMLVRSTQFNKTIIDISFMKPITINIYEVVK